MVTFWLALMAFLGLGGVIQVIAGYEERWTLLLSVPVMVAGVYGLVVSLS